MNLTKDQQSRFEILPKKKKYAFEKVTDLLTEDPGLGVERACEEVGAAYSTYCKARSFVLRGKNHDGIKRKPGRKPKHVNAEKTHRDFMNGYKTGEEIIESMTAKQPVTFEWRKNEPIPPIPFGEPKNQSKKVFCFYCEMDILKELLGV